MHVLDENISLRHLGAFMAVVQSGRITAASLRLRRSHSAISRSVAILEDTYGVALLTRSSAGVVPTAEGLALDTRCRIVAQEMGLLRELLVMSGHAPLRNRATSLFGLHTDVSRLRAVAAVHDFKSVQNAARFLGVSQPAVSAAIRNLEQDLDIELFVRTPRGMMPTPAGVTTAMSFKRILSDLRKIEDDIASAGGAYSGLVTVGDLAYSRNVLLPRAIEQVLRDAPQIVVRTIEGPIDALIAAMHAGEVDVVICARPNPALTEGIVVEPLVEDQLRLFAAASHPLAGRSNLGADEVARYPFIFPPRGSITRKLLEDTFRSAIGRLPDGSVETSSQSLIRNLVIGSDRICFRSSQEFPHDVADKKIVQVNVGFDLPRREICTLQRKGAFPTSALSTVLRTIREIAASV